jgi:hypothetical protein
LGCGSAGGLVVAVRVEGELAEESAGGGVDDPDVEVLHEEEDVGSGAGPAGADLVEAAGVAAGRSDHRRSVGGSASLIVTARLHSGQWLQAAA